MQAGASNPPKYLNKLVQDERGSGSGHRTCRPPHREYHCRAEEDQGGASHLHGGVRWPIEMGNGTPMLYQPGTRYVPPVESEDKDPDSPPFCPEKLAPHTQALSS